MLNELEQHTATIYEWLLNSYLKFNAKKFFCTTTNGKLHTLSRILKYTSLKKRYVLTKLFIVS